LTLSQASLNWKDREWIFVPEKDSPKSFNFCGLYILPFLNEDFFLSIISLIVNFWV
jgi:hypothetical protein